MGIRFSHFSGLRSQGPDTDRISHMFTFWFTDFYLIPMFLHGKRWNTSFGGLSLFRKNTTAMFTGAMAHDLITSEPMLTNTVSSQLGFQNMSPKGEVDSQPVALKVPGFSELSSLFYHRWLEVQVANLMCPQRWVQYLRLLRESIWPGGVLPKFPRPGRTQAQKAATEKQALQSLMSILPGNGASEMVMLSANAYSSLQSCLTPSPSPKGSLRSHFSNWWEDGHGCDSSITHSSLMTRE